MKLAPIAAVCFALLCGRPAFAQFGSALPSELVPAWEGATHSLPFPELARSAPVWLVRVRVLGAAKAPPANDFGDFADLTIVRSYTGPNLAGRHWLIPDDHFVGRASGNKPKLPRYRPGQEWIVAVRPSAPDYAPTDSTQPLALGRTQIPAYGLSAIGLLGGPWDAARIQYAEAIGQAYRAAPDQLEPLLRADARSSNPKLAVWATTTLGFWLYCQNAPASLFLADDAQKPAYALSHPAATLNWLRDLSKDQKVSALQQMALFEILDRIDPHWGASAAGIALLQRLCTRRLDGQEAQLVATCLGQLELDPQHRIKITSVFALMAKFLDNPDAAISTPTELVDLPTPNTLSDAECLTYWTQTLSPHARTVYCWEILQGITRREQAPTDPNGALDHLLATWEHALPSCQTEGEWLHLHEAITTLRTAKSGGTLSLETLRQGVSANRFWMERDPTKMSDPTFDPDRLLESSF